jgi:hypothetical protein
MNLNYLKNKTIHQILSSYDLPHRFLAYFASQCTKDAISKVKDPDPRSLAAISMAEAFGNGEDFSQEHMEKIYDDAYTAASAAYATYASAASAAVHAAAAPAASVFYASDAAAAHSASYATYAASASAAAVHAASAAYYKPLLLDLINKRLTKVERVLIFNQ